MGGGETTGDEQRKLQVGSVMGHIHHYLVSGLGKTRKSNKSSLEAKLLFDDTFFMLLVIHSYLQSQRQRGGHADSK